MDSNNRLDDAQQQVGGSGEARASYLQLEGESEVEEMRPSYRSVSTTEQAGLRTLKSVAIPQPRIKMPISERNAPMEPDVFDNTKSGDAEARPHSYIAWALTQAPSVPSYPICRFSIDIPSRPHVVAVRISDSLRIRSIVAIYEGASALCRTSSFVKFAIHIYAHDEGNSTIVEVVRHCGDGFAFRIERDLVQKAARGLGSQPITDLPCMLKLPEEFLQNYKGPTEEDHRILLERSTARLHSEGFDDKLFVLQNLCTNTASEKVNYDSCLQLSRLVLEDSSEIFSLISNMMVEFYPKSDDMSYQIVSACLGTIANCMLNLEENKVLGETLSSESGLRRNIINQFTEALMKIVEECKCAHNTASALVCFRLIVTNSEARNDVIVDMKEVQDIVEKAHSIGQKLHFNLEKEAKLTLDVLN